jgi:transposase
MNQGHTIFQQLISFLPDREFRRCVERYQGNADTRKLSCWDQYLAMAFAQLAYRESLRDIEACLCAPGLKRYHLGFHGKVARSTLVDANELRDWCIYADFAQVPITTARPLYAAEPMGVELKQNLYALDSTTIDLCLTLFPWARFGRAKAAVYPDALRRVTYCDPETGNRLKFLSNNFTLPALTIAQIYKRRWEVELFFKWIKQYLRIKAFFGTSENAVKTQIWIAVSVYVLVAIVRKRLELEASLYQILLVLSLTLFEKTPILQALQPDDFPNDVYDSGNQLNLYDL